MSWIATSMLGGTFFSFKFFKGIFFAGRVGYFNISLGFQVSQNYSESSSSEEDEV